MVTLAWPVPLSLTVSPHPAPSVHTSAVPSSDAHVLVMRPPPCQGRYRLCSSSRSVRDIDSVRRGTQDLTQRALGRLLSAARELTPTHSGSHTTYEPSSGPDEADSGHDGRKVSMDSTL